MDMADYIKFASALILVLAMMGILGLILKKLNGGDIGRKIGTPKRLSITEQRMIDAKHKMVLIKRDDVERLVILSNTDTIVVEDGIKPPKTVNEKPKNRKDIPVESV